MKQLIDFLPQIAKQVRVISANNYLLCGITHEGRLITDEAFDSNSFLGMPGDYAEQISIRGGTPRVQIEQRLAMLAVEGGN